MLEEIGETIQIILDLVKVTLKVLQQRDQLERKDLMINPIGPNGRALTLWLVDLTDNYVTQLSR